jgi:hypothetical protein
MGQADTGHFTRGKLTRAAAERKMKRHFLLSKGDLMPRLTRPDSRFHENDLVVVAQGPAAGETRRVWFVFGHRLRRPDGSLQYIYDVRPLSARRLSPTAALDSLAIEERELRAP